MAHISGFARDQLLLLPEAVDDYVDAENPVRFIDALVDGLGLTAAGFAGIKGKATGVGATRRGRSTTASRILKDRQLIERVVVGLVVEVE
jgi:hypothetical protein